MRYIVLEGTDSTGKNTQADLLVNWFTNQNYKVLLVTEPDSDLPTGKLLRQVLRTGDLKSAHAALFLADRLALQETKMLPFIKENPDGIVIGVRSFISTLVYQQDQWPLDWLIDLHRTLPLVPDLVLLLDISTELALERLRKRNQTKEYYENPELQERSRQRYHDLTKLPHLVGQFSIVDASGSVGETHSKILDAIRTSYGL
jgi:dTMP kinase